MKKTFLLLLLAVVSLFSACKKSKQANPCEGVAWLTAPTKIGVIFLDKASGENILLTKNIDASKITVTPTVTPYIEKRTDQSTYGALIFFIEQSKKGDFNYTINIPDVGTTTVSYTNGEKQLNNPCHPTVIVVGEPVAEGKTYTVERKSTDYIVTVRI